MDNTYCVTVEAGVEAGVVLEVGGLRGAGVGLVEEAFAGGILMLWPIFSLLGSTPGLAATMAASVTLYFLAKTARVSPATMVWVPPALVTAVSAGADLEPPAAAATGAREPSLSTLSLMAVILAETSWPKLVSELCTPETTASSLLAVRSTFCLTLATSLAVAFMVSAVLMRLSTSAFMAATFPLLLKDMNKAMTPRSTPKRPAARGIMALRPGLEEESMSMLRKEEDDISRPANATGRSSPCNKPATLRKASDKNGPFFEGSQA